jgi:hypothetical protein
LDLKRLFVALPAFGSLLSLSPTALVQGNALARGHVVIFAAATIRREVRHATLHSGERQAIVIRRLPSVAYQLQVAMPDGETLAGPSQTNRPSGTVRWSFIHPPGTITHGSRRATVLLLVGEHAYRTHYLVAFDSIDIVAPHEPVAENSEITLWVHTVARTRVTLQLSEPESTTSRSLETGPRGWISVHTRVQNASFPFQAITVTVVAAAYGTSGSVAARTAFQVLPFQFQVSLQNLQILHQVKGSWVATTSAHPAEQLRIQGTSFITEPAGTMHLCVSGYVTIVQGYTAVQMAPLQCADASSGEVDTEIQLSTKLTFGPSEVDIDAVFENGSRHVSLPISITSA